ncbi:MAG: hypothetical protein KatS3mg129_2073 [Leptospiraceae bacterium]|nr:MAG: hypothetical protein KatS3mg129_2073 [Leptospiraceae bacterium]
MESDTLKSKYFYLNILLVLFYLMLFNWVYFYVPLKNKNSFLIYFVPLLGIFSYPLWILIHDAIHGILFYSKTANNILGRVLCIYFGSPFRILQGGHLLHHGYNRTNEDINEYYNPERESSILAYIRYYYWLLGGLYLSEFLCNLILFIPDSCLLKIKNFYKNRSRLKYNFIGFIILYKQEIRWDAFINLIFYSIIFYIYGLKFYLFISFLFIRGLIISLMDNVFHYGTQPNKVISGYNLKTSKFIQLLILNANYHGLHHQKPKIPWFFLEKEFIRTKNQYNSTLFKQLLKQFNGPIRSFFI